MNIYGVHPEDKNLKFLKRTIRELSEKFNEKFRYLKLEKNYHSHEIIAKSLIDANEGLVLFFCHALDKSIRGCQIMGSARGTEHKDFVYGSWISPTKNIKVFNGKSVFCLACNSNDLGKYALENGALVYLGFDGIPFYLKENFKEDLISSLVKENLEQIVTYNLSLAIENNYTFNQLAIQLRLSFDKRRITLMKDKAKGRATKIQIANVLSVIRNGIRIYGDGTLNLLESNSTSKLF
ncbi:hypothetical protein [Lacinutrix sp. Hel_I_90]|uniref:hypothetical protein n=1 Tax=Lacinutrix sp. Hel_I_90 TaxID=1249999 RepID=UPI0005C83EE8|nr:hypothetical protein [Lacinutrix sp. Hel_I_90]